MTPIAKKDKYILFECINEFKAPNADSEGLGIGIIKEIFPNVVINEGEYLKGEKYYHIFNEEINQFLTMEDF